ARGRRIVAAAPRRSGHGGPRRVAPRLGAMVSGFVGKPSFVSGALFLSLSARQPILARFVNNGSGYVQPGHGRYRWLVQVASSAYLQDGPSCRRRYRADLQRVTAENGRFPPAG